MSHQAAVIAAGAPTGMPIGTSYKGGYYAGVIDTTLGNIIAADNSQTGAKYALILAPKTLESASQQWKTSGGGAMLAAVKTRWDGLRATEGMAADGANWPAADYCVGLAQPIDDGSAWYLPSMDELELIYRNFKPLSDSNIIGTRAADDFPGVSAGYGENVSSSPAGAAYTAGNPAQSALAAFQAGGSEAMGAAGTTYSYWSSTWAIYSSSLNYAWRQLFSSNLTGPGEQSEQIITANWRVRPVRRVLLAPPPTVSAGNSGTMGTVNLGGLNFAVDLSNPAGQTSTVTTVTVRCNSAGSLRILMGTWSSGSQSYLVRSMSPFFNANVGLNTFTVHLPVTVGTYIGVHMPQTGGAVLQYDSAASGYNLGYLVTSADAVLGGSYTMNVLGNSRMSLLGT